MLYTGLVEIRTIDTGYVVIKGVASSLYLCMEANGKLYGSVSHLYNLYTFQTLIYELIY